MYLVTLFFLGIDLFLYLIDVMVNKTVCCIDYRLCGTIITLQFEELGITISLLKMKDIANVCAAERIDTLGIIAHNGNPILRLC